MSDFTKGEWFIDEVNNLVASKGEVFGNVICEAPRREDGCDFSESFKFWQANARLIAAAPDLLEACQELAWLLDVGTVAFDDKADEDYDRYNAAESLLQKAIAKATGEPEVKLEKEYFCKNCGRILEKAGQLRKWMCRCPQELHLPMSELIGERSMPSLEAANQFITEQFDDDPDIARDALGQSISDDVPEHLKEERYVGLERDEQPEICDEWTPVNFEVKIPDSGFGYTTNEDLPEPEVRYYNPNNSPFPPMKEGQDSWIVGNGTTNFYVYKPDPNIVDESPQELSIEERQLKS